MAHYEQETSGESIVEKDTEGVVSDELEFTNNNVPATGSNIPNEGAENMALKTVDMRGGIDKTYPVRSRTSGALYQVTRWVSGAWSCDCADWIMRRSQSPRHDVDAPMFTCIFKGKEQKFDAHCKHIRDEGIPSWRNPARSESVESRFENLERV